LAARPFRVWFNFARKTLLFPGTGRKSCMNTVGKILVVFVTVTSLAFFAFIAAMRNGGPDWLGEMQSPEIKKDFVFSIEPGEKITYSVRYRRADTSVVDKTPILADAVLKTRKKLEEEANKKLQELSPQPQQAEDVLKALKETIPVDKAGVEAREKSYNDRIQQLWAQIQNIGNEFSATTIETQNVLRVAEERRGEVYRLSNQLELLRNDAFEAIEQQRVLEDERVRLEENRRRLKRRQNQLRQQLNEGY
jgi:hypothetical protein